MGAGEKTMTTWGYTAGGFCIGVGLIALIGAVMAIAVIKGNQSVTIRDNTVAIEGILIVAAIAGMIIGSFTVMKVYKANQLYLKIASEAATGQIELSAPPPRQAFTSQRNTSRQAFVPQRAAAPPQPVAASKPAPVLVNPPPPSSIFM